MNENLYFLWSPDIQYDRRHIKIQNWLHYKLLDSQWKFERHWREVKYIKKKKTTVLYAAHSVLSTKGKDGVFIMEFVQGTNDSACSSGFFFLRISETSCFVRNLTLTTDLFTNSFSFLLPSCHFHLFLSRFFIFWIKKGWTPSNKLCSDSKSKTISS